VELGPVELKDMVQHYPHIINSHIFLSFLFLETFNKDTTNNCLW